MFSPIVPVYTPLARNLADYLLERGYAVSPLTYPVVKIPRIRISIHVSNTEQQIDSFINELLAWVELQQSVFSHTGSASSDAGAGEWGVEAKARL